jgi:acyl-CoA hydrolase
MASAYMTFVALDRNGHPTPLPPLILETDEEKRRNREAKARRDRRLAEKTKEKQCQLDANSCELS